MSTPPQPARAAGPTALAVAVVLLAGLLCLVVFYVVGNPWGTLNDAGNGLAALLSAALAWQLRRSTYGWAVAVALAGAVVAVIGSYLVMSAVTGWYLAGLYTSLGYALIGLWLWHASGALRAGWPRGLARLGRFTGGFMALGVLAVPGLLAGIDSPGTAPWWAHAGFVGGPGWVLAYPIFCLWLGRVLLARPTATRPVPAAQ
ncbi:MAG: hypothetical protein IT317_10185 [Anaerolineales bacterium]|nr:hypothetical protein [Anaerolineales bacterium]